MGHRGKVKRWDRIFMTFSDLLNPRLPMHAEPRWTGTESAAFDLYLQSEIGIPASLLMENAGQATARWTLDQLASLQAPSEAPILVVAGPGNNGGDALVAARALHTVSPHSVAIWAPLGLPAAGQTPAGRARTAVQALGLRIQDSRTEPAELGHAAILIDGLFGIGLSRNLHGSARAAVEAMEAAPCPVLALDLPSGLHADTGEVMGFAPCAAATLSYIGPKRGHARGQGPAHCGRLWTVSIGVAPAVAQAWLAARRSAPTDES